jgi:phage gp36-like protein
MMANYCDEAALLAVMTPAELAQLADLDQDGVADAEVLDRACTNATDLVNVYISPRYTVPITGTVPGVLKTVAVRVAIYYLHLDRRSVTEDIDKQYERDISFLKDVGAGRASLGDPANKPEGDAAPGAKLQADDRDFTRGKMAGW